MYFVGIVFIPHYHPFKSQFVKPVMGVIFIGLFCFVWIAYFEIAIEHLIHFSELVEIPLYMCIMVVIGKALLVTL